MDEEVAAKRRRWEPRCGLSDDLALSSFHMEDLPEVKILNNMIFGYILFLFCAAVSSPFA